VTNTIPHGKEVRDRMKKSVSEKALEKEAAYWNAMKQLAKLKPGTVCHK
jgi:hypothetical protein